MPTVQSKHWVFTLNNYTAAHRQAIADLERHDVPKVEYCVYGCEVGESGTPHLQGFISFADRKRFDPVRAVLPQGTHIEAAGRKLSLAIAYCKKGDQSKEEWRKFNTYGPNYGRNADVTEYGTPPVGQGERTEYKIFVDWCKEQTSMPSKHEVIRLFPGVYRQMRIDAMMTMIEAHIQWQPLIDGIPTLRPW